MPVHADQVAINGCRLLVAVALTAMVAGLLVPQVPALTPPAPDAELPAGWQKIHLAVVNGDLEAVRQELQGGANPDVPLDVDDPINRGMTPLMLAAQIKSLPIVAALLEAGANPNARDEGGATALHAAAASGAEDVSQALLDAGAELEAIDVTGNTPLVRAAGGGHPGVMCVLLRARAASDGAARVQRGAWTPLMAAARRGCTECIDLLLREEPVGSGMSVAGIDKRWRDGSTALMIAAAFGTPEAVESLILADACVNLADERGVTALHHAAMRLDSRKVRLLLEAKADPNARTGLGLTPLMMSAMYSDESSAVALIERRADVNAVDPNGYTPLLWAAQYGSVPVMRRLIEAEVEVDFQSVDGTTALMIAVANEEVEKVRLMLRHGADPLLRDASGDSAMSIASGACLEAIKASVMDPDSLLH